MSGNEKNGAHFLINTLVEQGVDHCFANPGTSEMHLVEAIEASTGMNPVLCLFEGVCTGAADGFARLSGKPAATLLHLGAGLGNGVANLHNARRAATPLINIVGEHALPHRQYDAPLTSDIEGLARTFSSWVRTATSAERLAGDAAEAVRATGMRHRTSVGRIATLIVPADCAWNDGAAAEELQPLPALQSVSDERLNTIKEQLDERSLLLLGGSSLSEGGLREADRICQAAGCRMACITFPASIPLGPNLPHVPRLPYFPEQIASFLEGVKTLVLVDAGAPVSFFAYRDQLSDLTPSGAQVMHLAHADEDVVGALTGLAEKFWAPPARSQKQQRPSAPSGKLSAGSIAQSLAALVPEGSIISADSGGGSAAFDPIQTAVPVVWINLTGGAIGQGGPAALGAAVARPDTRVVALLGDGGAAYTIQYLWTLARHDLNVTTVIYNNATYQILITEYHRLGVAQVGPKASSLFGLGQPDIDWTQLAQSMGVPGVQVTTSEAMHKALEESFATPGPMLIDAVLHK